MLNERHSLERHRSVSSASGRPSKNDCSESVSNCSRPSNALRRCRPSILRFSGVGERVEVGDQRRGDKVAPAVDELGLD
jgi:hypothetical protein